jgi:hypothetical protein
MSGGYPYIEPPEPGLTGEEQREVSRAYAQAEEVASVAEELPNEAGGFDFTEEVRLVKAQVEELLRAIENTADSHNVRL